MCVCVLVGVGSLSRARKTHLYGHTFALKYQLKPIVVFQLNQVLVEINRTVKVRHAVLIPLPPLFYKPTWGVELSAAAVGLDHPVNASFRSSACIELQGIQD